MQSKEKQKKNTAGTPAKSPQQAKQPTEETDTGVPASNPNGNGAAPSTDTNNAVAPNTGTKPEPAVQPKSDMAENPVTATLTTTERERYVQLQATIKAGLQTFYEVGSALMEIRNGKLYREDYDTFEEFCREKYKIERAYSYRLMEAAQIKMSPIGDKIANEAQARAIAAVPEEQRPAVLKEAAKQGPITAKSIDEAAQHLDTVAHETTHKADDNVAPADQPVPEGDVRQQDGSSREETTTTSLAPAPAAGDHAKFAELSEADRTRVRRDACHIALAKIVSEVEKDGTDGLWRLVAELASQRACKSGRIFVCQRRGWSKPGDDSAKEIEKRLETLTPTAQRGLAVELLAVGEVPPNGWHWGGSLPMASRAFDIDLEQLQNAALTKKTKENQHAPTPV